MKKKKVYRKTSNDILEMAKLGTTAMLGTAMIGVTAGAVKKAFA